MKSFLRAFRVLAMNGNIRFRWAEVISRMPRISRAWARSIISAMEGGFSIDQERKAMARPAVKAFIFGLAPDFLSNIWVSISAVGYSKRKYKLRRRRGSPIRLSSFEVMTTNGMDTAEMVPSLGMLNCQQLKISRNKASIW